MAGAVGAVGTVVGGGGGGGGVTTGAGAVTTGGAGTVVGGTVAGELTGGDTVGIVGVAVGAVGETTPCVAPCDGDGEAGPDASVTPP
jgi:hypothetical protein